MPAKDDAQTTGKKASVKTAGGLSNVKMAFVYASVAYDLDAVLAGAKEALPECGGVVINGASFFRGFEMPFGTTGFP